MVDTNALLEYALELEEAAAGAGLAWLQARRDEALARMSGGGSGDYIETNVNGQQFRRTISATAVDWFEALQSAIGRLNGKSAKVTYARTINIPL